jgi:hypothetical protein
MTLRKLARRALFAALVAGTLGASASSATATTPPPAPVTTYEDEIGPYTITSTCNWAKQGTNVNSSADTFLLDTRAYVTGGDVAATRIVCQAGYRDAVSGASKTATAERNSGGNSSSAQVTFSGRGPVTTCVQAAILPPQGTQLLFGARRCQTR